MTPAPVKKGKNQPSSIKNYELPFSIIVVVYALVTVVTPNLQTLDSNGPKFLALAIVNLLTLGYLILGNKKSENPQESLIYFFRHPAGFLYLLLMALSLLSFVKAINIPEALMIFSKYFTGFTTAIILSSIFKKGKIYFEQMAVVLTALLIIDGISVYVGIGKYINRELESIALIKSVYSNKNILASAIFVKMIFALWLIVYSIKWKRILGFAGLFAGFTATLFMSTRAFYLGLILLTLAFAAFQMIIFFRNRDRARIRKSMAYLGILGAALVVYIFTQQLFYPKGPVGGYNSTITERLSTIESGNHSIQLRLMSWKNSWILIKQNPLLGVGIGNWRVAELEYENPYVPKNNYMLKAHNDFIEITTETGIFGGLAFAGIFLLIIGAFGFRLLKDPDDVQLPLLFAAGFGLIAYGVDAFFNFPSDRPEIHVLFSAFVGCGIAAGFPKSIPLPHSRTLSILITWLLATLTLATAILLINNFISLRYQRVANDEIASGKLKTDADYFLNGFPKIPNLTSEGEPIAITKAWFLITDKRYQEAIDMVRNDHASPFNGNRPYVIAWAYFEMGMPDSTVKYLKETVRMMPINYDMVGRLTNLLENKGRTAEAIETLQGYTDRVQNNPEAWNYTAMLYEKQNDLSNAIKAVREGLKNIPGDSTLLQRESYLANRIRISKVEDEFTKGKNAFEAKDYPQVVKIFTDILAKDEQIADAWEYRAKSYYVLKEYRKCISDLDQAIPMKPKEGSLYNLRGTCYYLLKEMDPACRDFLEAAKHGNKEGAENYRKVCGK